MNGTTEQKTNFEVSDSDNQLSQDMSISNKEYMRLHFSKRWPYLKDDLEKSGLSKEQITEYYREFLSAQAYIKGTACSTAKFFELTNSLCQSYSNLKDSSIEGYALISIISIAFFASTQDRRTPNDIYQFMLKYNPVLQVLIPSMPLYSHTIPPHVFARVLRFTGQEDLKHLMRAYVSRVLYLLKREGYISHRFSREEACRRFFVNYNLENVMESLDKVDIDLRELMKRFGKFVGKRSGVASSLDDGHGNEARRNSIFYSVIYERCRNLGVDITSDEVLDTFLYTLFNVDVCDDIVACYPTLQDLSLVQSEAKQKTNEGKSEDNSNNLEYSFTNLAQDIDEACLGLGKSRIEHSVFNVKPCDKQFALNQLDLFNDYIMPIATNIYKEEEDKQESSEEQKRIEEVLAFEKELTEGFNNFVVNTVFDDVIVNDEHFQSVSLCPVRKGSASLPDEEQDIYSVIMMPITDILQKIGKNLDDCKFRREPLQKWQSVVRVRRTNLTLARKILKRNVRYMVIRDYEDNFDFELAEPLKELKNLLQNKQDYCYFVTSLPCNHINFLKICKTVDPLGNYLSSYIEENFSIDLEQEQADLSCQPIHEFDVVKNTLQSTLRLLITRQRGDDELVQVRLIRDALESDIYYVLDGVVLFALIFNHIWNMKISNSTEQFLDN